ncbi:hypothetical protein EFO55_04270, partial [Lacticaseibacillus rhamnosus]
TNKPRLIRIISRPIFGRMFYGIYCQSRKSLDMPIIALNAAQLPSLFVNHGHLVSHLNDRQN